MEQFPDVVLRHGDLTLRPFEERDLPAVVEAGQDELALRWLPLPRPYDLESARWYVLEMAPHARDSGAGLVRAIEREGVLVGAIDLKRADWRARTVEIGYWTHPGARGQGVMPAATGLLAHWVLKEQGFERVELRIAPGNDASRRVAEKAGFVREGTLRNAGFVHGGRVDLVVFSLVRQDLGLGPRS